MSGKIITDDPSIDLEIEKMRHRQQAQAQSDALLFEASLRLFVEFAGSHYKQAVNQRHVDAVQSLRESDTGEYWSSDKVMEQESKTPIKIDLITPARMAASAASLFCSEFHAAVNASRRKP